MRWCETIHNICHQTTWNAVCSMFQYHNTIQYHSKIYQCLQYIYSDDSQMIITWRCKWKRCNWKLVEMISTLLFFFLHNLFFRRVCVLCVRELMADKVQHHTYSTYHNITHLWSINNLFFLGDTFFFVGKNIQKSRSVLFHYIHSFHW